MSNIKPSGRYVNYTCRTAECQGHQLRAAPPLAPRAHLDADSARVIRIEVGRAAVKVHIPRLLASDELLGSEQSNVLTSPVDVTMRRPTLGGVAALPLMPAPLLVRRTYLEEAGALAALLGRAFESERWDAAGTERELFGDETVRGTLVVAAEGRLVATAPLQVRPNAPTCGWVRWVATERDRRREGLARALVIGVLTMAGQAGCREAQLRTTTDRLATIRLYVQLGSSHW